MGNDENYPGGVHLWKLESQDKWELNPKMGGTGDLFLIAYSPFLIHFSKVVTMNSKARQGPERQPVSLEAESRGRRCETRLQRWAETRPLDLVGR